MAEVLREFHLDLGRVELSKSNGANWILFRNFINFSVPEGKTMACGHDGPKFLEESHREELDGFAISFLYSKDGVSNIVFVDSHI